MTQEAWLVWNGQRKVEKGERDNQFYTLARILRSRDFLFSQAISEIDAVYAEAVEDTEDFPIEQARDKVRRVYGR
jgi:hypothetical protein